VDLGGLVFTLGVTTSICTASRGDMSPLSWQQLKNLVGRLQTDFINGPTTSQAIQRLFGYKESDVRVTLYRDIHAWCPYCHKVWLWLEESRVPYRVKKVSMFCYGEKEAWYKKICPSGMLPALEIDDRLITESDVILHNLEREFGSLGDLKMNEPQVKTLRNLERQLFRTWYTWLCYPSRTAREENDKKKNFINVAQIVDKALGSTPGPYFLTQFSIADIVFVPFLERMSASLFYYKGFQLRDPGKFPNISNWFDALETRETYKGTQSDFHTHCHDLPPQMGGCYESGDKYQKKCKERVDSGTDFDLPDCGFPEPEDSKHVALSKVIRHWEQMMTVNPVENMDEPLRAALTYMMTDRLEPIAQGTEVGLRYIRDRISVPRDMPIWSARRFRQALEVVASTVSSKQGPSIPLNHRRDQDPKPFKRQK